MAAVSCIIGSGEHSQAVRKAGAGVTAPATHHEATSRAPLSRPSRPPLMPVCDPVHPARGRRAPTRHVWLAGPASG